MVGPRARAAGSGLEPGSRGGARGARSAVGVSVLRGGGARSVSRTLRSIASGRSGARVSDWLRWARWPGSIIWRLTDHRCPGFLGASSAPKRRPPSFFAERSPLGPSFGDRVIC